MLIFILLATMFTANDLKQKCVGTETHEQFYCLGYLAGFDGGTAYAALLEAISSVGLDRAAGSAVASQSYQRVTGCSSHGVTIGQVKLIFLKYVEDHPEQLHLPAAFIVSESLIAAFPCRH